MRARQVAVSILSVVALAAAAPGFAQAPVQIVPPTSLHQADARPHGPAPKPAKPSVKPAAVSPPATNPAPRSPGRSPDLAFGAYQRGYYLTAFYEATKRVNANGDARAMTLLGELYSNGLGVPGNDVEAAKWYSIAAGAR